MVGMVGKHLKDVNYNYQLPSLRVFISINSYYIMVKSYLFTDLPPLLDLPFLKEKGKVLFHFDVL